MSGKPWTTAEVEFLRANSPGMSYAEIASALGRTAMSVQRKSSAAGLPRRNFPCPFMPEEDAYLRENYESVPIGKAAAHLGRHVESVRKRSRVLGIVAWAAGERLDRWTEAEVAYLRDNYGTRPLPQLAAELGRSYGSTRNKVAHYELRKLLQAEIGEGRKRCTACWQDKELTEFHVSQSYCKLCAGERDRKHHYENKELRNRQAREAQRRKREEDKDYAARCHLRFMFGMTLEEYDAKLAAQGGVCAICGAPPGKKRLPVDHDHECCPGVKSCGKCIRDLLCPGCNNGTGLVDKPELLRKRAEYTERWQERHALAWAGAAA